MDHATHDAPISEAEFSELISSRLVTQLINKNVRRILKTGYYKEFESDDVTQELRISVHRAVLHYDHNTGPFHSYVATIIQRAGHSLITKRMARKRRPDQPIKSMDAQHPLAPSKSIGAEVANDDSGRRLGIVRRDATEALALKQDVSAAVSTLPEELRQLCELLSSHTPVEARQILKMTEKKFSERISLLREHFERVDINSY